MLTGLSVSSLLLDTNVSTIIESVDSNDSIASDDKTAKPHEERALNKERDTHGWRCFSDVKQHQHQYTWE